MERFGYGDTVTDIVTGYVGKVTGFVHYYGMRPAQYLVEGLGSDGPTAVWVDENRVGRTGSCAGKCCTASKEAAAIHLCED